MGRVKTYMRGFFRDLWSGFGSIGEGMANLLDLPQHRSVKTARRMLAAAHRDAEAASRDAQERGRRVLSRQMEDERRVGRDPHQMLRDMKARLEQRAAQRATHPDERQDVRTAMVRTRRTRRKKKHGPGLGIASVLGRPTPMTPKRREQLRVLGLSDMEISFIAGLGLPLFMEMLIGGMLVQAHTRAEVKTYPWWEDLGLEARPTDRDAARKAYSESMLTAHPDHGGSMETMAKVRAAWERAQKEFPETGK